MHRTLAVMLIACAGSALAAPPDDFRAGESAYRAGDVTGAMPLLRRAAEAGHAPAQALYGHILDVSEFNEEASRYYRRAAEQGNADGQFGLAALYAAGEGVEPDPGAARQWFERAAAQGHAHAINALARAFLARDLGFTAEPAEEAGLAWVRKAADQGYYPALDYLAKGLRSGSFGVVDIAQAERLEARMNALGAPPPRKRSRQK